MAIMTSCANKDLWTLRNMVFYNERDDYQSA